METSQEKCHEDRTNFEDDEEGWNDRQYTTVYDNTTANKSRRIREVTSQRGQLVVWLRFRPMDRRVAGSIPDSTNFLTNSSGQATNALVSLFTKQ